MVEKRSISKREEDEKEIVSFIPPSVPNVNTFESTTYKSDIPKQILEHPKDECILGVDEAGRGPVLGPMVYGVCYCLKSYSDKLKTKYGFADSKTLSEPKRANLLSQICEINTELYENAGWSTRTMSARDISSGMLRPKTMTNYNLNEQAHDATMDLIQGVLDQGVNITEIYVDTVGPPVTYQAKLQARFTGIKVTVTKKADSLFPVVSAASICAKVTRDASLANSHPDSRIWGCGYPSDSKTSNWLKSNIDPLFGWPKVVRFSWQTTKDAIKKNGGIEVKWVDEKKESFDNVLSYMIKRDAISELPISTRWYGDKVDF